MGIDGFQSWLWRSCASRCFIQFDSIKGQCDYLCIDLNSIIHQCASIPDCNSRVLLYDNVLSTIETLRSIHKPSKKTLICMDGAAPVAKMNQQRARRCRTAALNGNKSYSSISPNEISPGTIFMEELSTYIKLRINNDEYYFSDDREVGEGEHKIFKWLKHNIKRTDNVMIVGLDSDLIILSYPLKCNNVHVLLYDASTHTSNIFCIRSFKKYISFIPYGDLLIIMSLFGNDFIPDNPILKIYDDLIYIIFIYHTSGCRDMVNEKNGHINRSLLNIFYDKVSLYERDVIRYKKDHINLNVDLPGSCSIEEVEDIIKINRNRNIKHNSFNNVNEFKQIIREKYKNDGSNYLDTLQWYVMYYINNEPPDYYHKSNDIIAPFVSDMYKLNMKLTNTINTLPECYIYAQLLYILPPKDIIKFVPDKYHKFIRDNEELYMCDGIDLYNVFIMDKIRLNLRNLDINYIIDYIHNNISDEQTK